MCPPAYSRTGYKYNSGFPNSSLFRIDKFFTHFIPSGDIYFRHCFVCKPCTSNIARKFFEIGWRPRANFPDTWSRVTRSVNRQHSVHSQKNEGEKPNKNESRRHVQFPAFLLLQQAPIIVDVFIRWAGLWFDHPFPNSPDDISIPRTIPFISRTYLREEFVKVLFSIRYKDFFYKNDKNGESPPCTVRTCVKKLWNLIDRETSLWGRG